MRGVPKVLSVTCPLSGQATKWLGVVVRECRSPVVILAMSATIRRELLSGGLAEGSVHVLRPGIDMGRVAMGERGALRESWGVLADSEKVVVLLTDPVGVGDTREVAMGVMLADEALMATGQRVRVVFHPDQRDHLRLKQTVRDLGKEDCVIFDGRVSEPWLVLPGCDIAVSAGGGAGGLSLLWAMAGNVPIVGEGTYAVSEVVEDRHSALLVKGCTPRLLARRMEQLVSDPPLAWKLRDTARHEAYSFFSRQRYCQGLRAVYEQVVAEEAVVVPPMEVTGGLRFAGRA
jgi:glycosyltransferase involved in cell wall biosynthesis